MAEFDDWAPYIRMLLYGLQYDEEPLQGIDRVMADLFQGRRLDISPAAYLAAVRMALASDASVAQVMPQPHSEDAVRRYLKEVQRRLELIVGEEPA